MQTGARFGIRLRRPSFRLRSASARIAEIISRARSAASSMLRLLRAVIWDQITDRPVP